MYEEEFRERLIQLRMQRGVSAREMSLEIGQGPAYINNIESQKRMPSMAGFFYICDYLKLTPKEFFDDGIKTPDEIKKIVTYYQKLSPEQRELILTLMENLIK